MRTAARGTTWRWRLLVTLWGVACARAQYAVPMYAAPPVLPVMMPAVAVAQPLPRATATTTSSTTTTTRTPRSVAVAVPMPLPVQFPVPAYPAPHTCQAGSLRPAACPPCPPCLCSPSCTPAFFSYCSPCHQKCRCRDPSDAPQPLPPVALPVPLPAPPPVLVLPFPPIFPKPKIKHKPNKYTSSDETSCASSGSTGESSASVTSSETDYFYKRAMKRKSRRKRRRRPVRRSEVRARSDERVQPVLTYLSRSGDIKYKARISEAEAERLLGERARGAERRPVGSTVRRALRPGRKEIVFRPPANKAISNLSVSFHISK